jgi:VCBS repeat-containing protein
MEALIGTVRRLNGNYFLRTPDGETKALKVGDEVHAEDFIYGETDNTYYDHVFVTLEGVGSDILLIKNEGRRFNEAMVEEHMAALNRNETAIDPDALETAAGEDDSAVGSTESTDNGFDERLNFSVDVEAELNRNISVDPDIPANPGVLTGDAPLDINNTPTADAVNANATEGGAVVSGQLTTVDGDIGATATFSLDDTAAVPAGFTFADDGSWSFDPSGTAYDHMREGAVQNFVIPVTVTDERGDTASTSITISLTGTNDLPTVDSVTSPFVTAVKPLPNDEMVFWYDTSKSDAGGNWVDQSGNNRNATEVGSSDIFTTDDHKDINIGSYDAKSIAVSFTTASVADTDPFQIIYEQGGNVNGYSISVVGDHAYAFLWGESYKTISPNYHSIDLGVIESDTDYSVIMVHDASAPNGGSLTAYLNGVAVGSLDGAGTMGAHSGDVGIGGNHNHTMHPVMYTKIVVDGLHFKGSISEVVAWNSALDATEVADVDSHMYPPADLTPPQTTTVEVAADDVGPGTVLFNISGTDIEDATLSFELADTHSGHFAIDANGAITLQGTPDERGGSYTLDVNVIDADGGTATQSVTVNVKPESVALDGHWDMSGNTNEVAGSGDVVDNGVLQRGATVSNGVLLLDGKNDYVSLGSSADINQPGPFAERSVSLWFKTDGSSGNQYLWGEGGGTRALQIYMDSSGNLHAQGYNKGGGENGWTTQTILSDTANLADGEWHNVTVTLAGDPNDPLKGLAADGFKLYVDGDFKESGTGGALYGHNPAKIGANYSGKNTFAGEIDEVRLYNSELSADEVSTINDAYIENSIVGTASDEIIAGSDLNDEIDGGGGSDTITAGAGNDTIAFESDDTVDGGAGFDTLTLTEPTVDFTVLGDNVSHIEEIRLEGSNQTVKLGLDDVVKMSDGADTMRLTADHDGKLQLSLTDTAEEEAQWEATGGSIADVNGHVYDIYTSLDHTVTLQVDQQLTVEDF